MSIHLRCLICFVKLNSTDLNLAMFLNVRKTRVLLSDTVQLLHSAKRYHYKTISGVT